MQVLDLWSVQVLKCGTCMFSQEHLLKFLIGVLGNEFLVLQKGGRAEAR